MIKKRVLVRDNKGVFLRMFKRKFKDEFEFSEDSFLLQNEDKLNKFDYSVFVVYDYSELVEFFELDSVRTNFTVCLFSKHLYNSLSLIEEIKDLILIDASKNKTELFEDLKLYFKKSSGSVKIVNFEIPKMKLDILQKALFYLT
ncbi:hypothetical protein [Flavobacterium saccharophilum]|uniref:Uncharacterized protein n=1 Tax=Flavobacterium saccharophilum TaxID=29534 RepID=A0A1M7IQN8_9FLAO|nr:hypothetical protein [Flavobacterium saccharophilum]SHM43005.1 hypothetical protein SAMN05444366_3247 [Flavobacterium saccharophilum]